MARPDGSALGDQLVPIALAFAVIELTGSASDLGVVLAASLVPRLLFLLAGGVWADRLPRQQVMLAADVVRGAAQALVALDLLAGSPQIWHLVVLAAIEGAASAFFAPAVLGLVSAVVEPERLQAANALMGLSRNAAGIAGPALAATLVALSSAGVAFALDAATFAVSVVTLATITLPHVPVERRPFGKELREGLQEMLDRPWYWSNRPRTACGTG